MRDPNDDEFVEFVNDSDSIFDLSGYKIYDAERLALGTPNHEFPENTLINPGQAVVVFGGGTPLEILEVHKFLLHQIKY